MAEQEIIEHTKNIYKVWTSKHGFWHKVREFVLEIFIIVFAISLSLWFHNHSEHNHEQADVKEFLTGLSEDMKDDVAEMESDKKSYVQQKAAYSYINFVRLGQQIKMDSLYVHYGAIFNTTGLNPNNGRFEGFKSSGKIGTIENKDLQNNIMDLYQQNIPSLLNSTNGYVARKGKLLEYMQHNHRRITDSTTNIMEVLNSEELNNICGTLTVIEEITAR